MSRNKIYLFCGLFFMVLLIMALTFRNTDKNSLFVRDLNEITRSGKLRIISEDSNLGILLNGDSISGFQYEILKLFSESIGVGLEIARKNDLDFSIGALKRGRYDIVARFIPANMQDTSIVLSRPLLISRQMLVQRIPDFSDKPLITVQNQLANDSIYIQRYSPHKVRLEHLSDEIADTIYIVEIPDETSEGLIAAVAEGRIRHTICHEQLARKYNRIYDNIDTSLPVSFSQPYSWMLNKSAESLQQRLNEFLESYIGSTDYWILYRKYY